MDGLLTGIGSLVMAVLFFWGAFLAAGIWTVKANANLDSQLTSWKEYHGWATVTEPSPLLVAAAGADEAVYSLRGTVGGYTCTVMYVSGFESYFLACALGLPGITGWVYLRRRGRWSYVLLRSRALFLRRPRTHAGLPEPDVLDLGFERAYRVTVATGDAVTLLTPPVRRSLARAATTVPVREIRIIDDLAVITAGTWTAHGHLDPLIDVFRAIAAAAPAEPGPHSA